MIGQRKLINLLNNLNELPRFIILNGINGCGKKTLGKEISKKFKYELVFISNKIDEIREMIDFSNETQEHIIYYIDNGNQMSLNALNSLLKITEETPNNVHIILGVENKELLLPTLLSRAIVWNFEEYSYSDFKDYLQEDFDSKVDYKAIYPNLSYLEKDVDGLLSFCIMLLKEYDSKNIDKYTSKIKINEFTNGYDLFQVIWLLTNLCFDYNMFNRINILNECKKQLVNKSFNKKFIFESMLMKFEEVKF